MPEYVKEIDMEEFAKALKYSCANTLNEICADAFTEYTNNHYGNVFSLHDRDAVIEHRRKYLEIQLDYILKSQSFLDMFAGDVAYIRRLLSQLPQNSLTVRNSPVFNGD